MCLFPCGSLGMWPLNWRSDAFLRTATRRGGQPAVGVSVKRVKLKHKHALPQTKQAERKCNINTANSVRRPQPAWLVPTGKGAR